MLSLRLAQVHHFQVHGEMGSAVNFSTVEVQPVEPSWLSPFMTGKAMQLLESMPARQVVPNAFIMGAAAAACREAKGCPSRTVNMVVSHTPMRHYPFVDTNVIKCVYNCVRMAIMATVYNI